LGRRLRKDAITGKLAPQMTELHHRRIGLRQFEARALEPLHDPSVGAAVLFSDREAENCDAAVALQ
jgi:hypothetical protein